MAERSRRSRSPVVIARFTAMAARQKRARNYQAHAENRCYFGDPARSFLHASTSGLALLFSFLPVMKSSFP
jgi:hypothetical protein